jgi:hypothetical protein
MSRLCSNLSSSTFYADDRFKSLSSTHLDEQSKRGETIHLSITILLKAYTQNTTEAIIMVKKIRKRNLPRRCSIPKGYNPDKGDFSRVYH